MLLAHFLKHNQEQIICYPGVLYLFTECILLYVTMQQEPATVVDLRRVESQLGQSSNLPQEIKVPRRQTNSLPSRMRSAFEGTHR